MLADAIIHDWSDSGEVALLPSAAVTGTAVTGNPPIVIDLSGGAGDCATDELASLLSTAELVRTSDARDAADAPEV